MKSRFEGPRGRELLTEALKEQRIVQHDQAIAARIAAIADLREFTPGSALVQQGDGDNALMLIVSGEVAVTINGRTVATRRHGESVGEMAIVSPNAPRSATVTATKPTLAAVISEEQFAELAKDHPHLWASIAKITCERLREREKFHREKNAMPIVFIGSSIEGLRIARAIVEGLKFDKVVPKLWSTPGLFSAGGATLDTLMKEVEIADFAVFVFGPDDKITSRDVEYQAPRDNVIFELGLFMGRLDRERAFIVKEHGGDIKIPTDLLGITPATYLHKPGQDMATTVEPLCNEIRRVVERLGAV